MNRSIKILTLLLLCGHLLLAQRPAPAPAQAQPILITGATAHIGNGQVIENAYIAFANGKLTSVSASPVNTAGYRVIDAKGKHVYPGFIAPNTQLGLVEIEGVRATVDANEVGHLNPNIRSLIAYNTDSEVTPTVRAVGVLLAQVTPTGGRIPGTSSVVQLDAWNWEDAAYKADDGVHLVWPNRFSTTGWWTGTPTIEKNESYEGEIRDLKMLFEETQAYSKKSSPAQVNLKLAAMKGLFDGSKKLYIHTGDAKNITESVLFAQSFGITPVIVGGAEAWMVADFLREKNVPVILDDTHRLPSRTDYDVDQPFKLAKQLHDAGVLFCFAKEGNWQLRNLSYQAGHAVGFGLDHEAAIQALTLNTAKILGIDDRTGSLENGKDANLFICEGDALDMRTNVVTHAFIQGREINLNNKQKELYLKYKKKYEGE